MTTDGVRGWCPSLHEPMAARDGLIVRVKPYVRGLSAADLRCIADAAENAGATGLELTQRSALQVRGLDPAGAGRFAQAMVEARLASPDPGAERRRNLQLAGGCGGRLLDVAKALEAWLETDSGLAGLPAKFGFAVTPGHEIAADIAVSGDDAGCILIGGQTAARAEPTAIDAVQALTLAFLHLAQRQPSPPRRMKGLIQAVGADAVLTHAGLSQAPVPPRLPERGGVGPCQGGFGLGVVFGVLTPAALRTAADLAERYGDGSVLLAPGRRVWLHSVATGNAAQIAADAAAAGFVVDPTDRRLRLDACIGRAGCARASEDVRAAAVSLAWAAPQAGLHVAGCAKGCARPGAAGVTLVSRGEAGRYDLMLDAAPSAPPTLADRRLDQISAHLAGLAR